MKTVTKAEFLAHIARLGSWVEVKHTYAGRCADHIYTLRGREVGHKTQVMKRGKVVSELFLIVD